MRRGSYAILVGIALGLGLPATVLAAGQRSFVASTGLDTYPCSLAQPCRSFNAAIAATSVGGEVVILDTAGYGPMTIDRSIKIIGPTGVYGGISVLGATAATTGITINAPGGTVILRGLDISGVPGAAPLPNIGIDIQAANVVHIEKSSISNFTQDTSACVRAVTPGGRMRVYLVDSFLRECRTGISADGTLGRVDLQIDDTRLELGKNTVVPTSTAAIVAVGGGQSVLRNSVAREFASGVITTNSSGLGAGILITGSQLEDIGTPIAIDAAGSVAQVTLERSEIVLPAAGPALTVNATAAGTARLTILDSLVHRGGDPMIKTTGGGGSLLNVDIVRSTFQFTGRILDHGYGAVALNDNHIDVCTESLVNSGSGNVVSKDHNNYISCDDLPGPTYITPALVTGK